ncbi:MAG: hypothetical protein HW410_942 [Nitrosarchaeum sp.]|nr:hypothetical protein [Nitrosarchaeum sp.]
MQKMKQSKFLMIAVCVIAISAITVSLTSFQDNYIRNLEDEIANKPFGTYTQDAYGETVLSLNDAKERSRVSVRESSSIPLDLEINQVRMKNDDIKMITQFFVSKNTPIKNVSTFDDVMDSHGIVIIQISQDVDPNFNYDVWLDDYAKSRPGMELVDINGVKALAGSGDLSKGIRSEVIFQDDDLQLNLVSVAYPKEVLIDIAQNMR